MLCRPTEPIAQSMYPTTTRRMSLALTVIFKDISMHFVVSTQIPKTRFPDVDDARRNKLLAENSDTQNLDNYGESEIFASDWFGEFSPANELHTVTQGRWAYLPVMQVCQCCPWFVSKPTVLYIRILFHHLVMCGVAVKQPQRL